MSWHFFSNIHFRHRYYVSCDVRQICNAWYQNVLIKITENFINFFAMPNSNNIKVFIYGTVRGDKNAFYFICYFN